MASEPGLAVLDPLVAPRRDNFNFGATPELDIEGFYVEDQVFARVELEVHDSVPAPICA